MREEKKKFKVLVGLDWADEKHDVKTLDAETLQSSSYVIENTHAGISEWIERLNSERCGNDVAVCMEHSDGFITGMLLDCAFITLYSLNPLMSTKYRQAFFPSMSKDDPLDAELLLELVNLHRDRLKPVVIDTEETRALEILCESRRNIVDDRTKCIQKLRAALKRYYPQACSFCGDDLSNDMACDFLLKWPSVELAKHTKTSTFRNFFYAHNCRSSKLIEERIANIKGSNSSLKYKLLNDSYALFVESYAKQIKVLNASIRKIEKSINDIYKKHEDEAIFTSLPGAGKVLAPRLLVVFGTDRSRYESASVVQAYSGIAPVMEISGKSKWVHNRWLCPKFMKQSFHEFAEKSIMYSLWAKAFFIDCQKRGMKHNAAVRALAFKWIRIIFKCWKTRTPYDESIYIQSLIKHGSPLAKHLIIADAI